MQKTAERRNAVRLPFSPRAYCEMRDDGREFCGTIRDISMQSIFVIADNGNDMSGSCDIQIVIEGNHSELEINNLTGTIVRNDDDGVAIRLDNKLEWFAIVPLYFHKTKE